MNLYFRLLVLLLKRMVFCPRQSVFDPCLTRFWVNPADLDINLHMNNGRYLSIMDLGRVDLMLKARFFWKLVLNGYYPVVISESIRFKKSLQPFQAFDLRTEIESWDEKDFFIVQSFIRGGEVYAEGYIKGRFLRRGVRGSIPTQEIFQFSGKPSQLVKITPRAEAQRGIESKLIRL